MTNFPSHLRLSNIASYIYVPQCHIFFTHSSVGGRVVLINRSVTSDSFEIPWTVAHPAPLSVGFPRQEYWPGLPLPSPGNLSDPGIESTSPALKEDSLPLSHLESP